MPSKYFRDFPVAFICSALRSFRLREVRNFETVSRKEGPERFSKPVDCTVCRCRTLLKTERNNSFYDGPEEIEIAVSVDYIWEKREQVKGSQGKMREKTFAF